MRTADPHDKNTQRGAGISIGRIRGSYLLFFAVLLGKYGDGALILMLDDAIRTGNEGSVPIFVYYFSLYFLSLSMKRL